MEQLQTLKSIFLPHIENVEDEKIKKIFEEYNRSIEEFVIAVHSDITRLHERVTELEEA